jgi:hypothetical protein
MGISICGFIEVSNLDEKDLKEKYAWSSCVDISCFTLMTDDVCRIMFGESKYPHEENWVPVAHRRGIPNGIDHTTAQAINDALKDNDKIPRADIWGFTHISYAEIKQINWQSYAGADLSGLETYNEWRSLFKIMDVLDERFHYQRLIVWFEW